MAAINRLCLWILLGLCLASCSESKQVAANTVDNAVDVAVEATSAVEDKTEEASVGAAEASVPTLLAVREAMQAVTPDAPPEPTVVLGRFDKDAVDLIVRWEVGSPSQYVRLYQGVICPGGASGPTIGIGYDLGTQTESDIRKAWGSHSQVNRLATASGQVGPGACNAYRAANRDIRVPYTDAIRVFTDHDWPLYQRQAARAYRNGWDGLADPHRYGLGSNGYNRGFSMVGSRNAEKRHTRDVCVPANDPRCTAADLVASCRIWLGTNIYNGLCNRRKDEARFVVRTN